MQTINFFRLYKYDSEPVLIYCLSFTDSSPFWSSVGHCCVRTSNKWQCWIFRWNIYRLVGGAATVNALTGMNIGRMFLLSDT